MPIYEYCCANCNAEYQLLRPLSKADEPAPCKTCGQPGQRQLSTFSFKANTYTSAYLKPSMQKPLRSYNKKEAPPEPSGDSPAS